MPSESWWLTRLTPDHELYGHLRSATREAARQVQAADPHKMAEQAEPAYYWMVHNSQHTRYFYTPSGSWAGSLQGHYSSLTIPLRTHDAAAGLPVLTHLVHPASGRGLRVSYGVASHSRRIRPERAHTYTIDRNGTSCILDTVTYIYDEKNLLTAVHRPDGIRRYTHNDERLIEEVWDVNGHREVTNTYDAQGRVAHQLTEHLREVSFVYAPGIMTIVADAHTGENSNIWRSDSFGRLSSMTAADGSRQVMRYDTFGNRISVTERDGSTISRSYDDRSRLIKQLTPEGALSKYT